MAVSITPVQTFINGGHASEVFFFIIFVILTDTSVSLFGLISSSSCPC